MLVSTEQPDDRPEKLLKFLLLNFFLTMFIVGIIVRKH